MNKITLRQIRILLEIMLDNYEHSGSSGGYWLHKGVKALCTKLKHEEQRKS